MTNTRYADDILLYASTLDELSTMTESLIDELKEVGLELNFKKTKILHTHDANEFNDVDYIEVHGEFIKVLHDHEFHRYLGRHLCLSASDRIDAEFRHRKHQAWAAFHKHKKVILNKHVSLAKRLQYFDMCVTPSMLFSLSSFPLSSAKLQEMDRLQRRMLRRIIGWRRFDDEDWRHTMTRMNDRMSQARQQYSWTA